MTGRVPRFNPMIGVMLCAHGDMNGKNRKKFAMHGDHRLRQNMFRAQYGLFSTRSFVYVASVIFVFTLIAFGTSVDAFASPTKNFGQTPVSTKTCCYRSPRLLGPSGHGSSSTTLSAAMDGGNIVAEEVESIIAGKLKHKWYGMFKAAPVLTTIRNALTNTVFVTWEFIFLAIVALGVKPLTRFIFEKLRKKKFKGTIPSAVSSWTSEFGKLGLIVYAFDVLRGILRNLGLRTNRTNISREFAIVLYSIWGSGVMRNTKQYILERRLGTVESGKGLICNQALNFLINTVAMLLVFGETLDAIAKDAGLSMSSFRTLLGSGGIFAGLAAQQPVRKIFSGLMLVLQDRFDAGDTIKLEDGTVGIVKKVGLLETSMLSTDGIALKLSNSDLSEQQNMLNLSRLETAHVVQTVKFRFKDVKDVDRLITSIKQSVKESCPRLITDNVDSYPFSVYWKTWDDKSNHIEISCYLKIKPYGNEYMFAKQNFFAAVARGGYLDAEGYLNPPPPTKKSSAFATTKARK